MTQLSHVTIKLNSSISLTENINDFYSKSSLSILINGEFHRFTASSPTSTAQMNLTGLRNNSLTNQDVPFDPCSDNRLRNSCMSLDEKTRTMSRSGSFRDGFEEGERVLRDFEGLHLLLFGFFLFHTRSTNRFLFPCVLENISEDSNRFWKKTLALHPLKNPQSALVELCFLSLDCLLEKRCQDMFSQR